MSGLGNKTFNLQVTTVIPTVLEPIPTSGLLPPAGVFSRPAIRVDNQGRIRSIEEGSSGIALTDLSAVSAPVTSSSYGELTYNNTTGVFTHTGQYDLIPSSSTTNQVIGSTSQTGSITLGVSNSSQTVNIGPPLSYASGAVKDINIGTGGATGGNTTINIGPLATSMTRNINLRGDTTHAGGVFTLESDASGVSVVDKIAAFKAKNSPTTFTEAGTFSVYGTSGGPSRFIIGKESASITFQSFMGGFSVLPANSSTGALTDNICNLGSSFNRFRTIYAGTGTIQTSDRNLKQDIENITEAERRVAVACRGLLRKFRFRDAVEEKGDDARIHFGVIAQDLEDAFSVEGLDAHRYGMFCEDSWYESESGEHYPTLDNVPASQRDSALKRTRLGVRYSELLAFIVAGL